MLLQPIVPGVYFNGTYIVVTFAKSKTTEFKATATRNLMTSDGSTLGLAPTRLKVQSPQGLSPSKVTAVDRSDKGGGQGNVQIPQKSSIASGEPVSKSKGSTDRLSCLFAAPSAVNRPRLMVTECCIYMGVTTRCALHRAATLRRSDSRIRRPTPEPDHLCQNPLIPQTSTGFHDRTECCHVILARSPFRQNLSGIFCGWPIPEDAGRNGKATDIDRKIIIYTEKQFGWLVRLRH
ncbi:hypothetical protein J6590_039878 [Homalodisca vitripennis]|nr:hypothetical protein J6590_039878 [Homalodisca vitripennis]